MKNLIILFILAFLCFPNIRSQNILLESFGPSFSAPIEIKHARHDRLFVVEKDGITQQLQD